MRKTDRIKETIFEGNEHLKNAWKEMDGSKTWWFDTTSRYDDEDSLAPGVPIVTDDPDYAVEDIQECCEDSFCTMLLSKGEDRVVIVVFKDLPYVMACGKLVKTIPWADYTKEGLFACKKLYPDHDLEAVILNPSLKTLLRYGIFNPVANAEKMVEMKPPAKKRAIA